MTGWHPMNSPTDKWECNLDFPAAVEILLYDPSPKEQQILEPVVIAGGPVIKHSGKITYGTDIWAPEENSL